jgi:chromosome segregation ATPase
MSKWLFNLVFLTALGCSLLLAGCDRGEQENALVEAAAARATLAETQVALARSEIEKNNLKPELAAVIQDRDKLQEQARKLTEGRDEAVANAKNAQTIIENLTNQLKTQKEKVGELQEQNKELQATIDLQKKVKLSG